MVGAALIRYSDSAGDSHVRYVIAVGADGNVRDVTKATPLGLPNSSLGKDKSSISPYCWNRSLRSSSVAWKLTFERNNLNLQRGRVRYTRTADEADSFWHPCEAARPVNLRRSIEVPGTKMYTLYSKVSI